MRAFTGCESRWGNVATVLFALAFVLLGAVCILQPLSDPDFWWHLKTGELIAKARALLPADPFNPPDGVVTLRERVILDGYWLWQVIAYGFYQVGGFAGIKLLNFLTLAAIYVVLSLQFWRNSVRLPVALPLMTLSLLLVLKFFPLERPQVASFLFSAILVGLFMAIRRGERPRWLLYPLMAVWGNLHGGVVIGVILLLLFTLGYLWEERCDRTRQRGILLWCAGGVAAALINPNGIDNFLILWQMGDQQVLWTISEFKSSLVAFGDQWEVLLFWGLLLVHFAGLWKSTRTPRLGDWLVSLFLAVIAVKYMRNVAFVLVGLLPMTGYCLEQALSKSSARCQRAWQKGQLFAAGLLLAYAVYMVQAAAAARNRGEWGTISATYPQTLATFLKSVPLTGTILNDYNWGGYLIWALAPQYRIIVDGRIIEPQVLEDYRKIGDASLTPVNGRPEYEVLLDKYGIDVAVMGTEIEHTGVNLLIKYLLNKPEWQPVYLTGQGCVLLKRNAGNAAVLKQYQIDKLAFLNRLIDYYNEYIQKYPGDYRRYFGRGELLGYMGHYDKAERDFAMVKMLDPDNPYLAAKLRQLEKLREQARNR